MSAFLGVVQWMTQSLAPNYGHIGLPDHPGLGPLRSWTKPHALFLHRQRINTPEDLLESQPTPAWDTGGCILFDGRLDDRESLASQLAMETISEVAHVSDSSRTESLQRAACIQPVPGPNWLA